MLSQRLQALLGEVQGLTPDEREWLIPLAQEMQAQPADQGVEEAWLVEIDRRIEADERGEAKAVSWDEAREKRLGLKKPLT